MCARCNWENTLSRIDDITADGDVRHKDRLFLESVYSTIEAMAHVTERQREVVQEVADRYGL